MSGSESLPLFVLPMVVLPGEIQQLRIFEPRYRQMLDDCLLDEKNFGLVLDDSSTLYNGWNGPRKFGCEVEIIHHETIGSNHFVEILGKRKFEIQEILSPALPPFSDELMQDLVPEEGIYPDLETILTKIPEESEYHKLYFAATVDYIEQKFVIEDEKLEELKSLLKIIISRIGSNLQIDLTASMGLSQEENRKPRSLNKFDFLKSFKVKNRWFPEIIDCANSLGSPSSLFTQYVRIDL